MQLLLKNKLTMFRALVIIIAIITFALWVLEANITQSEQDETAQIYVVYHNEQSWRAYEISYRAYGIGIFIPIGDKNEIRISGSYRVEIE